MKEQKIIVSSNVSEVQAELYRLSGGQWDIIHFQVSGKRMYLILERKWPD